MYVCMYVCMYVYTYKCIHTNYIQHLYIYIYVMYVYIYIHLHTYPFTCIHKNKHHNSIVKLWYIHKHHKIQVSLCRYGFANLTQMAIKNIVIAV